MLLTYCKDKLGLYWVNGMNSSVKLLSALLGNQNCHF
jgi:hypothetical protein